MVLNSRMVICTHYSTMDVCMEVCVLGLREAEGLIACRFVVGGSFRCFVVWKDVGSNRVTERFEREGGRVCGWVNGLVGE